MCEIPELWQWKNESSGQYLCCKGPEKDKTQDIDTKHFL